MKSDDHEISSVPQDMICRIMIVLLLGNEALQMGIL